MELEKNSICRRLGPFFWSFHFLSLSLHSYHILGCKKQEETAQTVFRGPVRHWLKNVLLKMMF